MLHELLDFALVVFEPLEQTGVRLEDAASEHVVVVDHLFVRLRRRDGQLRRGLKHRDDVREVLLEPDADGERDVAKARQNRRLHAPVQLRALQILQQLRHDAVAIRQHLLLERAA